MSILLPALSAAFAAFCVWLAVRIVNRREAWAKWTAGAGICLPVLYLLSFGPACWWLSQPLEQSNVPILTMRRAPAVYEPIATAVPHCPRSLLVAINWYGTVGLGDDTAVYLADSADTGIVLWGPVTR